MQDEGHLIVLGQTAQVTLEAQLPGLLFLQPPITVDP